MLFVLSLLIQTLNRGNSIHRTDSDQKKRYRSFYPLHRHNRWGFLFGFKSIFIQIPTGPLLYQFFLEGFYQKDIEASFKLLDKLLAPGLCNLVRCYAFFCCTTELAFCIFRRGFF